MKDLTVKKCSKQIYNGSFYGYSCSNQGIVERDGELFCGTHDPVRVAERQNKRDEQWKAEMDLKNKCRESNQRRREAGELGIELAEMVCSIPGKGERDTEIDVIKMPVPSQWAEICWKASEIVAKAKGRVQ